MTDLLKKFEKKLLKAEPTITKRNDWLWVVQKMEGFGIRILNTAQREHLFLEYNPFSNFDNSKTAEGTTVSEVKTNQTWKQLLKVWMRVVQMSGFERVFQGNTIQMTDLLKKWKKDCWKVNQQLQSTYMIDFESFKKWKTPPVFGVKSVFKFWQF